MWHICANFGLFKGCQILLTIILLHIVASDFYMPYLARISFIFILLYNSLHYEFWFIALKYILTNFGIKESLPYLASFEPVLAYGTFYQFGLLKGCRILLTIILLHILASDLYMPYLARMSFILYFCITAYFIALKYIFSYRFWNKDCLPYLASFEVHQSS